jgi:hypothetical protein
MVTRAWTILEVFLRRWLSLAVVLVVAAALVLGFWGWQRANPPATWAAWFNNAFRTLQLLTFQFPHDSRNLDPGLPWQLNVARFVLPAAALAGSYRLLLRSIANPTRLAMLGLQRGHIVLVPGKGPVGQALLREASLRHLRGVAVAPDLLALERARMEEYRLPIVPADPFDEATWHQVRADRADLVVVAHGSDVDNLNIVVTVAQALRSERHRRRPMLVATLENELLAEQVDTALDHAARDAALRYRRLSVAEEGARRLFLEPPLPTRKTDRAAVSHILIIGQAPAARAVLWQALTLGQDSETGPPGITVLGNAAELAEAPLLRADVIPVALAGLRLIACDLSAGLPATVMDDLLAIAPTLACVCLPDELAVSVGLALSQQAELRGCPDFMVAVHQQREDRFLSLLARANAMPGHARLVPFGGILPAGTLQRLRDERHDRLARAVHAHYEALMQRLGSSGVASVAWDDLPENLRHANRAAADHMVVKLARIGCGIVPATTTDFGFREDEIGRLARIEHRRWWSDRLLRGWRPGPRDNARRLHPDMIPFETLSAETQEKDRDAVRHIPDVLALAGLSIQR